MMAGTRRIVVVPAGVWLTISAACIALLLSSAPVSSSHGPQFPSDEPNVVDLSYFPSSQHDFGLRGKLSKTKTNVERQALDVLQLRNDDVDDFISAAFRLSDDPVPQVWNHLQNGHGLPQFRRKRAVTQVATNQTVPENHTGTLIDFTSKFSNLIGYQFTLISASVNREMFELSTNGLLQLKAGYRLDYENAAMRSINFVVHANSTTNTADMYEISATLLVINVNEPPVFETLPKPYLATIRTNPGAGYNIITLVAKDPEGARIHYEKTSVNPSTYNDRIELRTETVDGVLQCQLRTLGPGNFPGDITITITITAKDALNNGLDTVATISVLVGVRPPQFYQSSYQGAMPEKNRPQQTVYKFGSTEELQVQWKTFQPGLVSLALLQEGGRPSENFTVDSRDGSAYVLCLKELDYEASNPKTQALTLMATQRVGSVDLISNVSVTVAIEDTNDNSPVFDQSQYLKKVPENFIVGQEILNVTARDADTGVNAEIVYSLDDTENFEIETQTIPGTPPTYIGIIKVKQRLDYDREEGPYYSFQVMATDRGTPPLSSTSNVRVTVTNINDEAPDFTVEGDTEFQVQENAPVNQVITQMQATDKDGDVVTYRFTSGSQNYQKFNIQAESGLLTLTSLITDSDDRFILDIVAQDDGSCCGGSNTLSSTVRIFVQVTGVNKERPTFVSCSSYSPSVDEHSPVGTTVQTVSASDGDRGPNGRVTYFINQPTAFNINSSSGLITVGADIDRETDTFKQVTVRGRDAGNPPLEGLCTFRVTINDINDFAPQFDKPLYQTNITVDLEPQGSFLAVRAYDQDVGNNARITYSLVNDADGKFGIIPENGFIYLTQSLTQTNEQFQLTAMAKDAGSPPRNSTVRVVVNVKSGFSKPPTWDHDYNGRTYTVNESIPQGAPIIQDMTCKSNIADARVEFQLIKEDGTAGSRSEFFSISSAPNTNMVTVNSNGAFNYLQSKEHIVRIRCLNYGPVTLITEVNPKVVLTDTNNQIPAFQGLTDGRYYPEVQENKGADTSVMTIVATDMDETAVYNEISFSIISGQDDFSIRPGPNRNTATLYTRRSFDREEVDNYFVTVKAEDGAASVLQGFAPGPNTADVTIRVKITDVNDNPPYFEQSQYEIEVREDFYIDSRIEPAIQVQDKDTSDKGRHTYRITQGNGSPPTFGVRNGLGYLFLLRKLDYESGDKEFDLVIEASDGLYSNSTRVKVIVLDVNDNNPEFSPTEHTVTNITENDKDLPKLILWLRATDADVDRPNDIRYSLQGSSFEVSQYFSINERTGQLYVNRPLDRDPPKGRPDYQFTVVAADERLEPNYGYATVSVMPNDVNDNAPQFITDPLEGSVAEHSQNGTSVVLVQAEDIDYADNGTVLFSITDIVDGAGIARPNYFTIDSNQGLVRTSVGPDSLDRETEDTYRLTIMLRDKGTPQQSTQGVLTITLRDINDQSPVFQQKIYTTQMSEKQLSGEVIRVVATDRDIGENARISYILTETADTVHFFVKDIDNEGSIQVFSPVDYENPQQRFFNLTVQATDRKDGHEDVCYVAIEVLDFNDNAPVIQPASLTQSIFEDAAPGTSLANFTATDRDSGINKEFEFSISRASDPRLQFSIDPRTGVVKTRRRLDRETVALHKLIIQAIDKGNPPLTGTATLSVVVKDVNDNYPTFKEDYHPHVLEEDKDGIQRVVQEILARDPDAPPYGAPFGFELTTCPGGGCPCAEKPTCDQFQFQFNPNGDGGNGTATISTNRQFDREKQKYYLIPIVMWDMRNTGSNQAMTGTNTLTVTIADINDNDMRPGRQDMFVYNYKGMFGPLEIGRVYVEDLDDWDLPDKTFTFLSPTWMEQYFSVDKDTGMVTMQKGVPSNTQASPYVFQVRVEDRKFGSTVTSTVSVVIHDLPEEAVRNSGAVRLKGTSAEAFIKKPHASPGSSAESQMEVFQRLLATKLNSDLENVEIISVQDVEGGLTDVRYSVHGSPYYPSSQTDSIVALNKAEFEQKVGVGISEVPIDACAEEVFEGGCYNYMDITGQPAMVNSNGTSFVGVEVFIRAMEGCRAVDFPAPNECSGDYCYHGGTCVKDDFGVLSCVNCPEGFDGPRCQQLRHSFDGKSYALYPTLEQCEDSETSIEFITNQPDGLLFYNGPMSELTEDQPRDFIALELLGGLPVLNIDHGSGSIPLSLDGRDLNGNQIIPTLADGKWHKIEIIRTGKFVEMIVDDCQAAAQSGSDGVSPDTKPCRASASTPGENMFLNVATLLQVGGRATSPTYPPSGAVAGTGFDGCVRNLIHNSKYYDLHYKATPEVPSGENGCPREDEICGATCGVNGICTASFTPPQATCVCKPGWRGSACSLATTIRDLQVSSYIQWQLKNGAPPSYKLDIQVMYRTWDTAGVLFAVSTQDNSKSVTLELKDGRLQALYNLGDGERTLLLNDSQASDGQWHVARFSRLMYRAVLTLDAGEGRNYVSQRADLGDNVYMTVATSSLMFAGAITTNPAGTEVIDRDLTDTCIQDVRLNNEWMPMKSSENSESNVANHVRDKNVVDGCTRPDGCVPPPVCPPSTVCYPLWGRHECRCAPGFHDDGGTCVPNCVPNPCFQNAVCQIDNGSVVCDCEPIKPWYGQFCSLYPQESDSDPVVGMATATIAAIVVAVILVLVLALLAFFLVTWYNRRKRDDDIGDKFMDDDGDFDIRENVIFYDEEGAGEEDQNAYDLAKLPNPVSDPIKPPGTMPRRTEVPRGRSVPDDKPDVGDVLNDRLGDAEDDPEAPPFDTLISFADEGSGSDAGSLSSLGSSSSDASQDYDYLNDWGPKFAKLADMYGAGQEPE